MKTLFQENKAAIIFILKFVGLYLVLNSAYGFYVEFYHPQSDPITIMISRQVAWILSLFQGMVEAFPEVGSPYVALLYNSQTVVSVFEGCNGLNVMIVYISFLVAFQGPIKSTLVFSALGLLIIYLMSLLRVSLLFEVAYYYPDWLYFFHKYYFTAVMYVIVFYLWYLWVRNVKANEK